MKKRELEGQVGKIMLSARADRARLDYVYTVVEQLEARLEKLEATVGEELPRLFTRIEELERVRIELEAALIRVEGDKARQPERYWFEGEWWVKSYHSGVVGPGEVVLGRKDGRPYRWPKDGGGQSMKGWTLLRREGADRRLDDPAVARQPDEPMADMPETCPDCDDEYPGECATCKPETGPSDDGYWVNHELHEQVVAQRDEARAERDAASLVYDALLKGKKHDRLREGIERLARLYETYEPAEVGRKRAMELRNHARDLRALLDGDDE